MIAIHAPTQLEVQIRLSDEWDEDEQDAITEVNRAGWQAYEHIYTPRQIAAVFNHNIYLEASWILKRERFIATYVATTTDDEIIGFVSLVQLTRQHEGEVAALYVHPDYQGYGIGKRLWQHGLEALRQHGCDVVWVWTLERAYAIGFYARQGCVVADYGTYVVGDQIERAYGYRLSLA